MTTLTCLVAIVTSLVRLVTKTSRMNLMLLRKTRFFKVFFEIRSHPIASAMQALLVLD